MTQGKKPIRRMSLKPHKTRARTAHGQGGEAWWYEDRHGIVLYQHVSPGVVTFARIPWSRLMRAAERCGHKPDGCEIKGRHDMCGTVARKERPMTYTPGRRQTIKQDLLAAIKGLLPHTFTGSPSRADEVAHWERERELGNGHARFVLAAYKAIAKAERK